jgi:DNA-binding transcriptional LysR family regulator
VPRLIESLDETHPGITVTTEVLPTPQVLLAVRDGRSDAGVARAPAPLDGIRIRPLRRDDEGVLVAATHLLAERETVELRDAADHPVVLHPRSANPAHHDFIRELFAARGLRPPFVERDIAFELSQRLVADGTAVALVGRSTALQLPATCAGSRWRNGSSSPWPWCSRQPSNRQPRTASKLSPLPTPRHTDG